MEEAGDDISRCEQTKSYIARLDDQATLTPERGEDSEACSARN